MIRTSIVGYGTIAPFHYESIKNLSDVTLCAICDLNPSVEALCPEGLPFFTDYKIMYDTVKPDVVHICLPHYLHMPVSLYFAERGVHVFCEKPPALTYAQTLSFATFEKNHPEVKIGICLQNRLNESTEVLKELTEGGEYGKLIGCRAYVPWSREKEYYESSPWRGRAVYAGGGCMINQSVHSLDLLFYIGGDIRSLHASESMLLDYGIEVEDTVSARLQFANGAKGLFQATNCNYTNESVQIRFTFEKGTFLIQNDTLWQEDADHNRTKIVENKKLPGRKFYFGASHGKLISRFYQAIKDDSQDYIHVKDALMAMHLIDAIHLSSAENREVTL